MIALRTLVVTVLFAVCDYGLADSVFDTIKAQIVDNQIVADTGSGNIIGASVTFADAPDKPETVYFAKLKGLSGSDLGRLNLKPDYLSGHRDSKYFAVIMGSTGMGPQAKTIGPNGSLRMLRIDSEGRVFLLGKDEKEVEIKNIKESHRLDTNSSEQVIGLFGPTKTYARDNLKAWQDKPDVPSYFPINPFKQQFGSAGDRDKTPNLPDATS